MRKLCVVLCRAVILLSLFSAASVVAMTLSSPAPGNLFITGQPVAFAVADVSGDVAYELEDYFGEQVISGSLPAGSKPMTLALPGLVPGYYELRCTGAEATTITALGVVMDRDDRPLPGASHVGIDTALNWCAGEGQWKPMAQMLRIAGIAWVRERISWWGVQPGKDSAFNWGSYQDAIELLHSEGLHISQVFCSTPGWAYTGKAERPPEDLRTVYSALRAASSHFGEQIPAWEVYNEPSGTFLGGLADSYAGVLKAGYWGVKDGAPDAVVLPGSLIHWVTPFARNLSECGAGDYFDVLNVHRYHSPYGYAPALSSHREVWRRKAQPGQPVWLTETNLLFWPSEGPDRGLLGRSEQHRAARYVGQAVPLALAAGAEKIFFFMLPDRREDNVQFGFLRPDTTPYPSFCALSAAANILGESSYLGRLASNAPCDARAFSTPQGNVLVAWAEGETTLTIPTEKRAVQVANLFGAERQVRASGDEVVVTVGPEALYILDVGERLKQHLRGTPPPLAQRPALHPSRVVLVGHCDLPIHKWRNWYVVEGPDPIEFTVDAYNFDEESPTRGVVEVRAPRGWHVVEGRRELRIDPMGRARFTCQLWPAGDALGPLKLFVRGQFPATSVAPSVSYFGRDPALLEPARCQPLELDDPSRWQARIPDDNGTATIRPTGARHGFRIVTRFDAPGPRQVDLIARFDPPADFSAFDGLRFNLTPLPKRLDITSSLGLTDQAGACWQVNVLTSPDQPCLVLFQDLKWEWWSTPTASLDLRHIAELQLHCSSASRENKLTMEIDGFEAIKFK